MAAVHADSTAFRYKGYSQEAETTGFKPETSSKPFMKPTLRSQDPCTCATEDFILFAEFSEVTGPIPLLTLPVEVHADVNMLIMKIMSVDYQANSSVESVFCEDAQVLRSNVMPGLHAYVHYVTLHDLKARGFVRPLCISYISADWKKLKKIFTELRDEFLKATKLLKYSNRQWFMEELTRVLHSIKELQSRYFYHRQREEDGILSPEGQKQIDKTDISQLVQQYTEYKHLQHGVEPLLNDKTAESTLNTWKLAFMLNESNVGEVKKYLMSLRMVSEEGEDDELPALRSVGMLSPWGVPVTLWRLGCILHLHHSCPLETSLHMFQNALELEPKNADGADEAMQNAEFLCSIEKLVQLSDTTSVAEKALNESLEYTDAALLTSGNEAGSSYHSVPESISDLLEAAILEDKTSSPARHFMDPGSSSEDSSGDSDSFVDLSESDWASGGCDAAEMLERPCCVWSRQDVFSQSGVCQVMEYSSSSASLTSLRATFCTRF